MKSVRVLSVASEIHPLIETGGLADVTGALPIALKSEGIEVRTVVPGYPSVMSSLGPVEGVLHLPHFFGGEARLLKATACELGLFVLDAPHLFARAGDPYLTPDGVDWPDNALRFAALARIAADIGLGVVPSFVPDIVHAHDWHAALALAYLHYSNRPRPATVMTVHNLTYQGVFPKAMLGSLGLPPEAFDVHGVEYYGQIGFLKAGLYFADRITTISPTYAREILGDEGGMGLGGLLRERACDLSGILNGVDTSFWDPATDPCIPGCFDADMPSHFEADILKNRATNKAALQRRLGLRPAPDAFLLGVIAPVPAEGPRSSARQSPDDPGRRNAVGRARKRRSRPAISLPYGRTSRSRALERFGRTGRRIGPPDSGRRGCDRGAVALRAVRPDAALRLAIWHGSHRVPCRRAGGYGCRRR